MPGEDDEAHTVEDLSQRGGASQLQGDAHPTSRHDNEATGHLPHLGDEEEDPFSPVSYTHLTLPTKA